MMNGVEPADHCGWLTLNDRDAFGRNRRSAQRKQPVQHYNSANRRYVYLLRQLGTGQKERMTGIIIAYSTVHQDIENQEGKDKYNRGA